MRKEIMMGNAGVIGEDMEKTLDKVFNRNKQGIRNVI